MTFSSEHGNVCYSPQLSTRLPLTLPRSYREMAAYQWACPCRCHLDACKAVFSTTRQNDNLATSIDTEVTGRALVLCAIARAVRDM